MNRLSKYRKFCTFILYTTHTLIDVWLARMLQEYTLGALHEHTLTKCPLCAFFINIRCVRSWNLVAGDALTKSHGPAQGARLLTGGGTQQEVTSSRILKVTLPTPSLLSPVSVTSRVCHPRSEPQRSKPQEDERWMTEGERMYLAPCPSCFSTLCYMQIGTLEKAGIGSRACDRRPFKNFRPKACVQWQFGFLAAQSK